MYKEQISYFWQIVYQGVTKFTGQSSYYDYLSIIGLHIILDIYQRIAIIAPLSAVALSMGFQFPSITRMASSSSNPRNRRTLETYWLNLLESPNLSVKFGTIVLSLTEIF